MLICLNGYETLIINISLLNTSLITPISHDSDKKRKRLKKTERESFFLNDYLKEILVGLLLGDLFGRKKGAYVNFIFKQGLTQQDYLNHLYSNFKNFTASAPKIVKNSPHPKNGKCYNSITFYTYSLPCFNELYNLFYVSLRSSKKVIPINIFYLLTPVSLAY
jgi:hypothetical protein